MQRIEPSEPTTFQVGHQPEIDLRVSDPAFRHQYGIEAPGKGDFTDGIFYEILLSPAGLRSMGVNQLSKNEIEETYAGSTDFKRWQHVAGTYRMVRHFARIQNLDEGTTLQYALIACLPDLGHGVKSHVTDMLKEGMGGNENFHEQRAGQVINLGGIKQILTKYGVKSPFRKDGTVKIDVPPWVESDMSVDQLHYINAEASLLFPDNAAIRAAIDLNNFVITEEGQLAFKAVDHARVWAKAANLCSSEHWNDPANRLIEFLSLEAIKRTISKRYLENIDSFDKGHVGSPEDYTFLIDVDFDNALERQALSQSPDLFMNAVYSLVQSIAQRERQRFARHKRPTYEAYIDDPGALEYPNALINPHRAAFGIPPAQIEIRDHDSDGEIPDGDAMLTMPNGVPIANVKQLKFRQYDPLVVTKNGAERLSKLDPNFKNALKQNAKALTYIGTVALHANPESSKALIDGVEENKKVVKKARKNPSLSPDQIRAIIASSADRALELAIREGRWVELGN